MSTAAVGTNTPFKGLAPFDDSEQDALLFFGREREREIVIANLMASRLTVLYGATGVGKSSLLRAGVARGIRGMSDAAVVVFSSWLDDVVEALRHAVEVDLGVTSETGESLADLLAAAAGRIGGDMYVILDQFEEYFLYHDEDDFFGDELADVVRRPGLRSNVLIGIREDAVAKLDAFKGRIPGLFANSLRLERLERAAGEAAILGPVNAYNSAVGPEERVEVEPRLVSAVLDEVTAGRVELGVAGRGSAVAVGSGIEAPYLQLVLERLWRTEGADGSQQLRLSTLERLGGAQKIVEDHLNHAMATLSPAERDAAAAMYNHLVTPSGMKIAHGVADLARYAAVDEVAAAAVLQRLSDQRIVRAGENGGAGRYEIFHDVLADAVLAWRTKHEADRRLGRERLAARRRHRVLVRVMAGAIAALAVVAGIAIYALVQRSAARHQAAVAHQQQVKAQALAVKAQALAQIARHERQNAEQQADTAVAEKESANAASERAVQQKHVADQQKHVADQQRSIAQRSATAARAARATADQNAARAENATMEANDQAVRANKAAGKARAAAAVAYQQRRRAQSAEARTLRQKQLVRARKLTADARALLDEDPEKSVKAALAAMSVYRAAHRTGGREVEDTLREALLSLRVEAVLPGGDRVQSVSFSPDGSEVLIAGGAGARVFDRAHRYRSHALQPAAPLAVASFSPNGRLIAAGGAGADHNVFVWDAATGALLYALPHRGPIRGVAFSPNGELLATASADGNARLWSLAGGIPLAVFPHPAGARSDVREVTFSPDGKHLLTVGGDRFARVFDVETQQLVLQLNGVGFLNSAQYSHDGRLIATAGNDRFVRMWDARTGDLLFSLRQESDAQDVTFSPDDTLVATGGGRDTLARVWRLADRSAIAMVPLHLSGVEQVRFSPDGRSVVSRGRDGNVYVWAANGGFTQARLLGHVAPVNDVAVSRDGVAIVTGSDDGTARVWDGRVSSTGPTPPAVAAVIGRHTAPVNTVAFSRDGRYALSASDDGTARLWGPRGRKAILRHDDAVTSAFFSRDSKLVITASRDGTGRVWRVGGGSLVATLRQGAPINRAVLSPDGRTAVTAGTNGVAIVWDARTGTPLYRLQHAGAVNDAEFSPNGRLVVTASDDRTAAVWRIADGRRVRALAGHAAAVTHAVFAPDGRSIATGSEDGTARIWDVRTGATEYVLAGHTAGLTDLAFDRSGSLLATASLDHDVRVWAVRSGQRVALLRIHSGFVSGVSFSADDRWLATAGPEAVGIWEANGTGRWSGTPLYLVQVADRPTTGVAFSPRGWRIVTGSRDGSVRMFDCAVCAPTPRLVVLARKRLGAVVRPR